MKDYYYMTEEVIERYRFNSFCQKIYLKEDEEYYLKNLDQSTEDYMKSPSWLPRSDYVKHEFKYNNISLFENFFRTVIDKKPCIRIDENPYYIWRYADDEEETITTIKIKPSELIIPYLKDNNIYSKCTLIKDIYKTKFIYMICQKCMSNVSAIITDHKLRTVGPNYIHCHCGEYIEIPINIVKSFSFVSSYDMLEHNKKVDKIYNRYEILDL
jgi:hypothetical protein